MAKLSLYCEHEALSRQKFIKIDALLCENQVSTIHILRLLNNEMKRQKLLPIYIYILVHTYAYIARTKSNVPQYWTILAIFPGRLIYHRMINSPMINLRGDK